MSFLRFIGPLLVLLLLGGCGKDELAPIQSSSVKLPKEKVASPLQEKIKKAFIVASPARIYSDSALSNLYYELPVGTEVAIHGEGSKHYEIRVNQAGKIHTAYLAKKDVLVGTLAQAQAKMRQIDCSGQDTRPENATLLAGMLQDGKLLPGYEVPVVKDEDFLDLGLEFVDTIAAEPVLSLETPHLMEVIAPHAQDAFVKVKDQRGGLIVAFYVRAGKTAEIDLPSGKFTTYFATGRKFSSRCGVFLENLKVSKDETVLEFTEDGPAREVSYSLALQQTWPAPSAAAFTPKLISQDEFLKE